MAFFNGETARRLTPATCHYASMWLYDVGDRFDTAAMGRETLDRMVVFNHHTGRCFACLGKGANLAFGHGRPGEFLLRLVNRDDNGLEAESVLERS